MQLSLPKLRAPRYSLPMLEVGAAVGILHRTCPDITADNLRELIERGAFWAWNIASPGAETPDLRLLTHSVAAMENAAELLDDPYALCQPSPADAAQAVCMVLGWMDRQFRAKDKPWFTGSEIKTALSIRRTHMIDLVREKALTQLPGTNFRQGPNGYPLIQRESLIAFLNERLIDA